eukprot:COSAG01_NODE_61997_length_286_cov_11.235294_1_plen_62_part_10
MYRVSSSASQLDRSPRRSEPQANVCLPAGQGSSLRVAPPLRDLRATPQMWGRLVARLRGGDP